MQRKTRIVILILFAVLLSSCAQLGESTVEKCIVGEWLLVSDEAYARALVPPGSFEQNTLKYNSGGGLVVYSFNDKDQLKIQAPGWVAQFSVVDENMLYQLDFQLVGEASGEYHLEENMVRVDSYDISDLGFVAIFDGEAMLETNQASDFAPLFLAAYNTAQFDCTEATLSLNLIDQPGLSQPIIFQRVVREKE